MNNHEDDYMIKINSDLNFEPIVYSSNTNVEASSNRLKQFVGPSHSIWSFIVFIIGFLSLICLIWSLFRFYSYLNGLS